MLSFLPLDGIMKYEQKPQTPIAPQTRTRLLLLLYLSKGLERRRRRQPLPLLPAELRREWELPTMSFLGLLLLICFLAYAIEGGTR